MPSPRIFRSRWAALLWAGGILWTAYDVSSVALPKPASTDKANGTDATGTPVDSADLAILANAVGD